MFSSYMLLKLVRRSRAMRSRSVKDKPAINNEYDYHDHLRNKCRVCLQQGEIPIFGNMEHPNISSDIQTFANIEININDRLPKMLCQSCHKLLEAAIVFRNTAKQTELILKKKIKVERYEETSDQCLSPEANKYTDPEIEQTKTFPKLKKKKIYVCKVCYIDFKTLNEYYDHVNTIEHKSQKGNPNIQCKICNKTLKRSYLKKHLQLHKSESLDKIKCKICKQLYNKGEYQYHLTTHRPETSYICDICGKSFSKRNSYYCHLQTHSSEFPFECEICPYKGRNLQLLKTHIRSHTRDYRHQCQECLAWFLTSSNLNRHMAKHRGRDYECDSCKRRFYAKHELEQHFKVDHLGHKDFVCNICDKAFGYRNALQKHQLHVHKREKFVNGRGRMPAYLAAEQKKLERSDLSEMLIN